MSNRKAILFIACTILFFYGCVSTHIVSSWKDPAVKVKSGDFKKVLVLALVENESSRRIIEDKLVSLLKTQAVPSYSYLTKEDLAGSLDGAKEKMKKDGFDGIITMRLLKVEQDVNYVPGTYPSYYASPWSYGAFAVPMYYDAGYYAVDDVYKVETNFYALNPEKLLWSGITETLNPQKVEKAVDEIAKVVRDEMVDEGFFVETTGQK